MAVLIVVIVLLAIGVIIYAVRQHKHPPTATPQPDFIQVLNDREAEIVRLTEERDRMKLEAQEAIARVTADARKAIAEAALQFEQTRNADRKTSNARSRTALVAKIGEHMAPFLPGFNYNPKDARHIGELIDFIVYDGLEDGEIREVVFLEVKTKESGRVSNPREKQLRAAIAAGRVSYKVFVPSGVTAAKRALEAADRQAIPPAKA